jgi:hypothetical protein
MSVCELNMEMISKTNGQRIIVFAMVFYDWDDRKQVHYHYYDMAGNIKTSPANNIHKQYTVVLAGDYCAPEKSERDYFGVELQ